jgi:periplasmic copper chaperone A
MKSALFVLFLMSAPLAALAHQGEAGHREGQIHATQGWARINPVPGRPAAVFLTLHNASKTDDQLLSASTALAARTEMHRTSRTVQGVMRMAAVASVPVKAGETVTLAPGGVHLMLFDLKSQPKAGSRFTMTLRFAKGAGQTIMVTARGLADRQAHPAGAHEAH